MVQPSESGKVFAHPEVAGSVVSAERYERGCLFNYMRYANSVENEKYKVRLCKGWREEPLKLIRQIKIRAEWQVTKNEFPSRGRNHAFAAAPPGLSTLGGALGQKIAHAHVTGCNAYKVLARFN